MTICIPSCTKGCQRTARLTSSLMICWMSGLSMFYLINRTSRGRDSAGSSGVVVGKILGWPARSPPTVDVIKDTTRDLRATEQAPVRRGSRHARSELVAPERVAAGSKGGGRALDHGQSHPPRSAASPAPSFPSAGGDRCRSCCAP